MKFRTEQEISSITEIQYQSSLIFLGSCFANHMGNRFNSFSFNTTVNPFGTLYHPNALLQTLEHLNKEAKDWRIFEHQNIWRSWLLHSDYSALDEKTLVNNIEKLRVDFKTKLAQATHVFITLGSAFQYNLKANNELVANCHKVPQKNFNNQLTSITSLTSSLKSIQEFLKSFQPKIEVIFTVSPVRHLNHGLVENNRSKARLLEAVHCVCEDSDAKYLPAYELVMDDLRDYRFMESNLTHPNEMAINYIWNKISDAFFNATTQNAIQRVEKVKKALAHRAFHPDSEEHQQFLLKTQTQKINLEKELSITI